jgi:putative acetyltransferase
MIIRETTNDDLDAVLAIVRSAFQSEEEAQLVSDLLGDPTAEPRLSLMASIDGRGVGHILFTAA